MGGKTHILSVAKACSILQLLNLKKNGLTTTEVSSYLGLNRSTTHHLLSTLQVHSMVTLDVDTRYRLGSAIIEMAGNAPHVGWRSMVHSIVVDVANETRETTYLSLFDEGINFLDIVLGQGSLRVIHASPQVGEEQNLHARSSGKLYLCTLSTDELRNYIRRHPLISLTNHTITDQQAFISHIAQIKSQGYATDEEEYDLGVTCCSFPFEVDNRWVGALSVSFPTVRADKIDNTRLVCQKAVHKISKITTMNILTTLIPESL